MWPMYIYVHETITSIKIMDSPSPPRISLFPFISSPFLPPRQLLVCFLSLKISLHFMGLCISWIIWYVLFIFWLLLLSIFTLRSIHVVVYLPTNSAQVFPFLYILTNTCYLIFLTTAILQVWGNISLWFWFAFPWWLVTLSTFSCTWWSSVCLLWKNVHSGSKPILKSDRLFCSSFFFFDEESMAFILFISVSSCSLLVFRHIVGFFWYIDLVFCKLSKLIYLF